MRAWGWRDCADLHIGSGAAALVIPDREAVELPWQSYGVPKWVMDGPPLDRWCVTHFTLGRGLLFGIGIAVSGQIDERAASLWKTTMNPWRRLNHLFESGTTTGHCVPIVAATSALHLCSAERATLGALCIVLHARPELRARLDERARAERLAHDLSTRPLPGVVIDESIRGRTLDIEIALHQLGYVHRFGRPLPGQSVDSIDTMVAKVRGRLARLPEVAPGRSASADDVERVIRTHYLDQTPWPFDALFDD